MKSGQMSFVSSINRRVCALLAVSAGLLCCRAHVFGQIKNSAITAAGKTFTRFNIARLAGTVLILLAAVLWCATPARSQVTYSNSRTDPYTRADGTVGKKSTTYTKYKNGDESTETKYVDVRGKLYEKTFSTVKSNGAETIIQREYYDQNGKLRQASSTAFNASGAQIRYQVDGYQDGILKSGRIWEYDTDGHFASYKEYNPSTERYETSSSPPTPDPFGHFLNQSDADSKKSEGGTKSKGPAKNKNQSRGGNEEVFESWWQFFTNDQQGLDNLKFAILDCDPELRTAVQKWIDAAKTAGEQNKKAAKARNALRSALFRAKRAKDEAAKAKQEEKETKEKAAAKAQEEAEGAQKTADAESQKEVEANKTLKESEKNVDPNVRKMVAEAAEKELQKPKQERADEKTTTKPPPCPPKGRSKGGSKIDACLVGEWRAESLASEVGYKGGAGIALTINGSGTETIDYNNMQPIKGNGETHLYRGIVVAEFTTAKGAATATKAVKSDLTVKQTYPDGRTTEKNTKALGPAALGNYPQDRSYSCDGTTLKFKAVLYTATFKREKK